MVYYAAAILALGFLIVVHEAGHYFVARWCGMRVERFSIGFGPGILKRKSERTGTVFQLAPIPFGGFVEIRGMNIAEEVDPEDAQAYPNRPAWQRFVTIFAGPGTNYLSAIVLAFVLFKCHGVEKHMPEVYVAETRAGYAAVGKLQPGDRLLKVDDVPIVWVGKSTNLNERVAAKRGGPVTLVVLRDGVEHTVTITPKLSDESPPRYLLGIGQLRKSEIVDAGMFEAAWQALKYPVDMTVRIGGGLYDIIRGKEEAEPAGPVGITNAFRDAFKAGFREGIELLMVLSVYLGLFNLFPLPALDGGRLVFLSYELVTRRRANPKIEAMVHMSGIMLLGIVMILVTLNDCNVI